MKYPGLMVLYLTAAYLGVFWLRAIIALSTKRLDSVISDGRIIVLAWLALSAFVIGVYVGMLTFMLSASPFWALY